MLLVMEKDSFSFLELQAGGERLADGGAEGDVVVAEGVVGDGVEFLKVDLAVGGKDTVVDGHVDDLTDKAAGGGVVALHAALEREGQLGEDGRVNALALLGVPAGTRDLVGHVVARNDADVVGGNEVLDVGDADGESAAREDVGGGLVVIADADRDLALLAYAAPSGIHGVGGAVLVIRADDQHGHGIKGGLCAYVFSHFHISFFVARRLLFCVIIIA